MFCENSYTYVLGKEGHGRQMINKKEEETARRKRKRMFHVNRVVPIWKLASSYAGEEKSEQLDFFCLCEQVLNLPSKFNSIIEDRRY